MTLRDLIASLPANIRSCISLPPDPKLEDWCWLCNLEPGVPSEYGWLYGVREKAHVYMWNLYYGPPPAGTKWRRHHMCEEKKCCNPLHMILLTCAQHARMHVLAEHVKRQLLASKGISEATRLTPGQKRRKAWDLHNAKK